MNGMNDDNKVNEIHTRLIWIFGPSLDIIENWDGSEKELSKYIRECDDIKKLGRMALSGKRAWLLRRCSVYLSFISNHLKPLNGFGLSIDDINNIYALSFISGGEVLHRLIAFTNIGYAYVIPYNNFIDVKKIWKNFKSVLTYFDLEFENQMMNGSEFIEVIF
jgi:hypothetical protein